MKSFATILFLCALAQVSLAGEAKKLELPDFSGVTSKNITDDITEPEGLTCTDYNGVKHKRGTDGFSTCMNSGKAKKIRRKSQHQRRGIRNRVNVDVNHSDQGVKTSYASQVTSSNTDPNSQTKSCGIYAHGQVKFGYVQPVAAKGSSCTQASQTCMNGQMVGPAVFDHCQALQN